MLGSRSGGALGLMAVLVLWGAAACDSGPQNEEPSAASPSPLATPDPVPDPTPIPEPHDPFALAARYESPDPETLTERLVAAEEALRDPSTPDVELQEMGRVQQAAYRQLIRRPEWREVALPRLPEGLRSVAEANIAAGSELGGLTEPREDLPDNWTIVAPASPDELRAHYAYAQERYGIGWEYLAAIHLVETRMSRIVGESHAGAQGPMQFMPPTWGQYGEGDVWDDRDAILAAARYLRASGGPNEMDRALFAYNRSQRYVRAITLYAEQMRANERAYLGYYHWEVYYRTVRGDALLLPGWGSE